MWIKNKRAATNFQPILVQELDTASEDIMRITQRDSFGPLQTDHQNRGDNKNNHLDSLGYLSSLIRGAVTGAC